MELIGKKPERRIVIYFLSAIIVGAFILYLPVSSANGHISFIDALFTATSAICVTGLVVLDVGKDFSLFGQIVIMLLIQIGGLGIMTLASALLARLVPHLSVLDNLAITHSLGSGKELKTTALLKAVFLTTIIFEGIGAIALFIVFQGKFPFGQAVFNSIFHSISAFCNAGFSTFSNSLESYSSNIAIIGIFSFLIISGGLGFIVIGEIIMRIRSENSKLSLHSKLAITTTIILLVVGTIAFIVCEDKNALKHMGALKTTANAFFQAVTARTAGFSSIPQTHLTEVSLLITMILMFIGACPGSTAGGIKTTTIATVFLLAYNRFRGRTHARAFNRSISNDSVDRAVTVLLIAMTIIVIMFVALLFTEERPLPHTLTHGWFVDSAFEVLSAFGTVGLSLGITTQLHDPGKIIIILLMFAGRVGLLTLIFSLAGPSKPGEVVYIEEQVMIG
jgi:trk system potassium uptake protein TrkH